jgi:hypothetical protein
MLPAKFFANALQVRIIFPVASRCRRRCQLFFSKRLFLDGFAGSCGVLNFGGGTDEVKSIAKLCRSQTG